MIEISRVKKTFPRRGQKHGFSLEIPELVIPTGQLVYIVGPNGSGKSTLLDILSGVIIPDGGRVWVEARPSMGRHEVLSLEPHARARFFGVVPQESAQALVEEMSIADHVLARLAATRPIRWAFPRRFHRAEVRGSLVELQLSLEHRMDEPVGNLSGGERQALAVLLATLGDRVALLLDEFTASLDLEMAERVTNRTISIIREHALTALFVTHDLKEATRFGDRIVVLQRGRIAEDLATGDERFSVPFLKGRLEAMYAETLAYDGGMADD